MITVAAILVVGVGVLVVIWMTLGDIAAELRRFNDREEGKK